MIYQAIQGPMSIVCFLVMQNFVRPTAFTLLFSRMLPDLVCLALMAVRGELFWEGWKPSEVKVLPWFIGKIIPRFNLTSLGTLILSFIASLVLPTQIYFLLVFTIAVPFNWLLSEVPKLQEYK